MAECYNGYPSCMVAEAGGHACKGACAVSVANAAEWPITINSASSKVAFFAVVDALFAKEKYVTFSGPRIGPDRSLDQNALFHLWASECWFYYQSLPFGKITKREMASMKRSLKKLAYIDNGWPWLVQTIVDVFDHNHCGRDYTSSADWSCGEMYQFLTWLQMKAANDGLILESKGEYAKLQREQNK